MAREKPLDLTVVRAWLAAWDESDVISDAAVLHLRSLISDTHCLVVITLMVGREPRSLVFRRLKRVLPPASGSGAIGLSVTFDKWPWTHSLNRARSMFIGLVAPASPAVGQLWSTGVNSDRYPKLPRVLRWDGADWATTAGYVYDSPIIMKQGKQACDFRDALAEARASTKWFDCEFVYTYDGSTSGNA
jgi:hypothetical protein